MIEVCSIAGWVCDLMGQLGIEVQVANTSDDAWRRRKVKQKDDRRDALKAAQLSAVNQLREVYIPQTEVRQWRALIAYRRHIVGRCTKIKITFATCWVTGRTNPGARQQVLEQVGPGAA